jgi:threonyl-tRNA synthetase
MHECLRVFATLALFAVPGLGLAPAQPAIQKTPYILVFGDKEEAAGSVSVRTRGKGDQGSVPLAELIAKCNKLMEGKSTEL